jgi:cytochrome oxidase Cu insertion factor (SCO1/SenC/PrrC family)
LSLVALIALFLMPLIVAVLVFYVFPDWRPTGKVNHGQLITPVRPVPAFELGTLDGGRIDETFLRGKWTLVYLNEGRCDKHCIQRLYTIRQVRLAQGKNIDRLQRLLLWRQGNGGGQQDADLQQYFPGQVIAPLRQPTALLDVFAVDGSDPFSADRVYLVDPLGNLMMHYEPGDEPHGMIRDLERLLKYSGLG